MERIIIEYKPNAQELRSLEEALEMFTEREVVEMVRRYQAAQEHARNYREKAALVRKQKDAMLKELEARLMAKEKGKGA